MFIYLKIRKWLGDVGQLGHVDTNTFTIGQLNAQIEPLNEHKTSLIESVQESNLNFTNSHDLYLQSWAHADVNADVNR